MDLRKFFFLYFFSIKIFSKFNFFFRKPAIITEKNKKMVYFLEKFSKSKQRRIYNVNHIFLKITKIKKISKEYNLLNFVFLKKKIGSLKTRINFNKKLLKLNYIWKKSLRSPVLNVYQNKSITVGAKRILNKKKKATKLKKFKRRAHTISFKKWFLKTMRVNWLAIRLFFFKKKIHRKYSIKFVSNLKRKSVSELLHYFEFRLINILVKANFAVSYKDCLTLLEKNIVYVNNVCVVERNYILKKYDTVRLVFYYNVLFYILTMHKNLNHKFNKINFKMWKLRKRKKPTQMKISTYPSWVKTMWFFKVKVPRYIELDYRSLSATIIFNLTKFSQISYINKKLIAYYMMPTYNWKRIT